MFNEWWKQFDPFDYQSVKSNINKFNQKVINFWKDFYNDVYNNIKREEK